MFPIFPVPNSLIEMFPMIAEIHYSFAFLGAIGFTLIGLIILMFRVPGYNKWQNTKGDIIGGICLVALGILSLVAGLYTWALVLIGIIVFFLWVLVRGIIIVING